MFRFSLLSLLVVVLCVPHSSYAVVQVAKGTITAVRPCYPSGYAFSLDLATTSVIYQTGVTVTTPKGVTPKAGQKVYTLLGNTVTCDIDPGPGVITLTGKSVSYFSSSTPVSPQVLPPTAQPSTGTSGGSAGGSGGSFLQSQLQGLAGQVTNSLVQGAGALVQNALGGGAVSAVGTAVGGVVGGAAGAVSGGLIYGGTYTTVIPCNGGIFYIPDFIGTPYAGPITWLAPAPPFLVNGEVPPSPTQCHIGRLVGVLACFVGNTFVGMGPRIQFYGSSIPGCVFGGAPSPAAPKPANAQCPQNGTPDTAAQKVVNEKAVRGVLSQCGKGIGVTSSNTNGGACGFQQDGVKAGCTDVGNLQCGSMDELCTLAQCAAFDLGGGSEFGHSGAGTAGMHGSGNAVDINHNAAVDQCIKSKFTPITCPAMLGGKQSCWINPATGAIYYDEPVVGTQGAHWHVCMNGFCKA